MTKRKIIKHKLKIKTEDGFTLDAIYNEISGSEKTVIFTHGITVDKEDEGIFVRAEPKLNSLGISTIRFDFRGHGKSTGTSLDFTISGGLVDLDTIFNFIVDKNIKWIGLAGASFGGGIAALYVGSHKSSVDKLFLANPTLDFDKSFLHPTTPWAREYFKNISHKLEKDGSVVIGSRNFKLGKKLFEEMRTFFPYENLQKFNNPILIVHGRNDTKISHMVTQECYKKLINKNKKLVILKRSEHGFHEEPYESKVVNFIINFFKN